MEIDPHLKLNLGGDNLSGCDSFISSPTGRWGMAMAREAWPNALNAQLFNSKVGVQSTRLQSTLLIHSRFFYWNEFTTSFFRIFEAKFLFIVKKFLVSVDWLT